MTQPFPYVAIVSGVGSVVFANGAGALGDYTINRQFWAPSVAPLRTNRLGGRGRYSETIEELDINVTGSTVAALYANLNTLNLLLDEAERFAAGDPSANPVTLRYAPQGSTVSSTTNFLRALILGRAPGDTSRAALNNPPNFMDAGVTRFAQKVRLRLWRRGRWLAPQAGSSASASTANANLMSITGMTSLGTVSPVARVSLAGFSPSATPTINGGYLALVDDATALLIQNMSGATAAGYTTQNDSGNLPRGGTNVLRYTPAGTAPATSGNITGLAPAPFAPVMVLAVLRNNNASRAFQIRANLSSRGVTVSTPYQTIDAGSVQPRVVRLGIVRHPYYWDTLSITCAVDSTSGSPTLDIDYLVLVTLRDETCRVIQHDAAVISALTAPVTMDLRFSEDTQLTPFLGVFGSGGATDLIPLTYYDAIDAQSRGTALYAAWFATNGQYWRFTNTSNAVVSLTASVIRQPAYLGPQ